MGAVGSAAMGRGEERMRTGRTYGRDTSNREAGQEGIRAESKVTWHMAFMKPSLLHPVGCLTFPRAIPNGSDQLGGRIYFLQKVFYSNYNSWTKAI